MIITYASKAEKEVPDRDERYKINLELKYFKDRLFLELMDKGKPREQLKVI